MTGPYETLRTGQTGPMLGLPDSVTACLFDLDGVLTDTASVHKAAWKDIAPLTLEYYMGQAPVHQPKVQARVAYDENALYIIWKVEDRYVLARRTQHQQDVYRDSCVEFFFTPGGDPGERGYFNLETNCTGVKLLGVHVAGNQDAKVTAQDFASIVTASSRAVPCTTRKYFAEAGSISTVQSLSAKPRNSTSL